MDNRKYYEELSDKKLAEFMNKAIFKQEVKAETFCKNVCKYADENGFCTKLNKNGEVDCELSMTERIQNWLKAERK